MKDLPQITKQTSAHHQHGFFLCDFPGYQMTAPSTPLRHDSYLISVESPYSLWTTAHCAKVGKLSPAENEGGHLRGFPFPQCL